MTTYKFQAKAINQYNNNSDCYSNSNIRMAIQWWEQLP